MVLVGMGIDTQKAGYLQKDYGSGGGGERGQVGEGNGQ